MAPKDDNNAGIKTGDQVLVWLQSYGRDRPERQGLRFAEVERVTRTQIVVEGINYYADPYDKRCGEPARHEHREWVEVGEHSGRRRFAHPNTVKPIEWESLIARKDYPEAVKRAQDLNSRAYAVLGYPHLMSFPQILELAKDPVLMTNLETVVERTERIQQDALEDARAYFTRYAPARED